MTTQKNLNDILDSVAALASLSLDDMKNMDHDTLNAIREDMRFFYNALNTVAAQKQAEKTFREETQKHIDDRDAILNNRQNINANVQSFDNLNRDDRMKIVNLGKIYHAARRINNNELMEKAKNNILEQLCDHGIGNMYVVGHVIHLAK